jgi:DNA-binding NarL/FixJ family response regulator
MRVLVAEGQEIVRAALRRFLREMPDITLVSEVVSAANLLAQAREVEPDLVLLDWELADLLPMNCSSPRESMDQARRQLLSVLHALPSHPQIVVLSREPELHQMALDAGVDGFVSKGDSPERVLKALHAVATKRGQPETGRISSPARLSSKESLS